MVRKRLIFLMVLILTACAGDPPARMPALRSAAESANRMAVQAVYAARWEEAVASWHEALAGYQSMDDWQGQGRARLGLGQAYARLGRGALARKYLEVMPEQRLFAGVQRACAAYQLALLEVPDDGRARVLLDQAWRLCGKHCPLAAQLDNLAARLAAGQGAWVEVGRLARRALDAAGALPAERAHAHRLLAEAALARSAQHEARMQLEAALVEDRQLAEPEWLLEDYRLLERIAVLLHDEALAQEARVRQKSLCLAARLPVCSQPPGGNP